MRLSELPEELVSNISVRLGCEDVCSLRLCSRALEQKTLHEWAREYFSEKAVHFTSDSLKVLVNIAKSKKLSKYLKEVYVMTALFSKVAFDCPGDNIKHWTPTVRQSEAYRFYLTDQTELKRTRGDEALLTEAFESLPELKKLVLLDTCNNLKLTTDYRGLYKTTRVTGTCPFLTPMTCRDRSNLVKEKEHRQWLNHVWNTLLRAMAATSDTLRLDDFGTHMSHARHSLRPKQLDIGKTTLSRLAKVFQDTTRLQLQFMPSKTVQENKKYGNHMQTFAALFTKITNLSLSFESSPYTGPLFRLFMSKFNTSAFTELNLREMATGGDVLCKLIARSPKLKELKLDGIDLTTGDWPPVLKAIAKLEHVDHLHLMYLREAGNKAYFLKQLDQDDPDDLTPGNAFAHMMGSDWDDDDDDEDYDDDDDDLPDLEPADGPVLPSLGDAIDFATAPDTSAHPLASVFAPTSNPTTTPAPPAPNTTAEHPTDNEPISDYVPSGTAADYGERGFYICISGHAKIMRELQVFIKEYNLGEALEDEMMHGGMFPPGFAGLAGLGPIPVPMGGHAPPAAALATLFGGAVPTNAQLNGMLGGFGPPPPHHHHHHHHHHGPGHGAAAPPQATAAPPPPSPGTFGPPLPPHMMPGTAGPNATQAQTPAGAATVPAAGAATVAGATASDDDGWVSDEEDEGDDLPDLEDELGGVAVD